MISAARLVVFDREGVSRFQLLELIPSRVGPLMPSRRLPRNGEKALARARAKGREGVIAKIATSPYEPGIRSRAG